MYSKLVLSGLICINIHNNQLQNALNEFMVNLRRDFCTGMIMQWEFPKRFFCFN